MINSFKLEQKKDTTNKRTRVFRRIIMLNPNTAGIRRKNTDLLTGEVKTIKPLNNEGKRYIYRNEATSYVKTLSLT